MPGYHKKTGVGIDSSVWTRHDGKAYIINPTLPLNTLPYMRAIAAPLASTLDRYLHKVSRYLHKCHRLLPCAPRESLRTTFLISSEYVARTICSVTPYTAVTAVAGKRPRERDRQLVVGLGVSRVPRRQILSHGSAPSL